LKTHNIEFLPDFKHGTRTRYDTAFAALALVRRDFRAEFFCFLLIHDVLNFLLSQLHESSFLSVN